MEFQIEGRHFQVTVAIQQHVEEKLGKLLRYFDGIHTVHVILEVEKATHKVEVVCTVAKRQTLVAKGQADDLYAAVDKAGKKMETELKKFKAKLRTVGRGKGSKVELLDTITAVEGEEDTE